MPVFVSAIVPVYNDASGIRLSLERLLSQSYAREAYEIIVVDNGSTDDTIEVVRRLEASNRGMVKLVVEDQVRGSYAARNRGIRAARGEILAFTDADCVPAQDWMEAGVKALQASGAASGGGRVEFTYKADRPNVFEYFDSARKLDQKAYVEKAGFAVTANLFARRVLFDRHGFFRPNLVSGGDYEFGRRVTGQGEKLVYIHDAMVQHPARSTFGEIYRKSRRVALGQKQLARLGLLDQSLSLRQLLPARSWNTGHEWAGSLSMFDKLQLILLHSIVQWLNLLVRIT
jgi:glycosyltransferase involved in cell wall biosynthesis